jgi:hypothetical protein
MLSHNADRTPGQRANLADFRLGARKLIEFFVNLA